MFKLYYLFDSDTAATSIYADENIDKCFKYMEDGGLNPSRCLVISPNGTKITFDRNDIIFHSAQTYRIPLHATL